MADHPPYPGTPRWVQLTGIVVLIVVLLVVVMALTGGGPGGHGPGRHAAPVSVTESASPPADSDGHTTLEGGQ